MMLALFVMLGCKGENGEPTVIATYNAGLAVGFVAGAEDRAPQVADAVAGLDADVVCLQEVWAPAHVAALEDAAAESFPNQIFADPLPAESTGKPACAKGDLDDLLVCVGDVCGGVCQDQLVDCVFTNCVGQFLQLPKSCQGCTMANVGGTPEEIQAICEKESTSYAYGGSFGTGILSKHPFVGEPEHAIFDPELFAQGVPNALDIPATTNRRGIHHAVIQAPLGEIDVYCTHLTPVFVTIPYPRDSGSWAEEQAAQIQALHSWIGTTDETDTVIMAGDFNTGPAKPGIDAEVPDNYAALASGYANFYAGADPECTFCEDNPLVGDAVSVLIDHVLVRGFDGEGSGERLFTDTIPVETCDTTIDGALSDHYGLALTLEP
jgi:endonuclease/exonuclease/phosphatase family metal-dependent hydrolase